MSLILASQTFYIPRNSYQFAQLQQSLLVIGAAAVGILVAASLLNHWLPRVPFLGNLLLPPPSPDEAETIQRRRSLAEFDATLVGARGTTVTAVLPTGKARFGDKLLDIMAYDADTIERGVEVEVVEVRGNRIFVRPVRETA